MEGPHNTDPFALLGELAVGAQLVRVSGITVGESYVIEETTSGGGTLYTTAHNVYTLSAIDLKPSGEEVPFSGWLVAIDASDRIWRNSSGKLYRSSDTTSRGPIERVEATLQSDAVLLVRADTGGEHHFVRESFAFSKGHMVVGNRVMTPKSIWDHVLRQSAVLEEERIAALTIDPTVPPISPPSPEEIPPSEENPDRLRRVSE